MASKMIERFFFSYTFKSYGVAILLINMETLSLTNNYIIFFQLVIDEIYEHFREVLHRSTVYLFELVYFPVQYLPTIFISANKK